MLCYFVLFKLTFYSNLHFCMVHGNPLLNVTMLWTVGNFLWQTLQECRLAESGWVQKVCDKASITSFNHQQWDLTWTLADLPGTRTLGFIQNTEHLWFKLESFYLYKLRRFKAKQVIRRGSSIGRQNFSENRQRKMTEVTGRTLNHRRKRTTNKSLTLFYFSLNSF